MLSFLPNRVSIDSKSFGKIIPLTTNKMCTTILKEMNVRKAKIKARAWSLNCTLAGEHYHESESSVEYPLPMICPRKSILVTSIFRTRP